ncbi:hypothetical protein A6J66_005030 [Yersinia enterocolitica]|nr:hypothetical protein A6J66_005030 [Yersinia enterocolitica]
MLLLLVMDYGLTLFYLANSISNDIHCVHSIKQQDILPMLIPTTLLCSRSDTALPTLVTDSLSVYSQTVLTTSLSLTWARCCP